MDKRQPDTLEYVPATQSWHQPELPAPVTPSAPQQISSPQPWQPSWPWQQQHTCHRRVCSCPAAAAHRRGCRACRGSRTSAHTASPHHRIAKVWHQAAANAHQSSSSRLLPHKAGTTQSFQPLPTPRQPTHASASPAFIQARTQPHLPLKSTLQPRSCCTPMRSQRLPPIPYVCSRRQRNTQPTARIQAALIPPNHPSPSS